MVTETAGRNEAQAMNNKYKEILKWEAEFTQQIEQLKNIDKNDKEAKVIAQEIIKAWDDRKNIEGKKTNLALSSNSKRITRLENKLIDLGYQFTKQELGKHNGLWYRAITIEKLS
ncbi:hypothetical protein ABHN03_16725 [Paenibacillus sp. NRS-1775]|uniref:hypothetical protein n=1 Tax=unclassified Paenibacillus TaxID=185978 RepID=UPI003D29733E